MRQIGNIFADYDDLVTARIRSGITPTVPPNRLLIKDMLYSIGVKHVTIDRVRRIDRGLKHDQAERPVDALCGSCASGKAAVDPDGWVYPCVFSRWLRNSMIRFSYMYIRIRSHHVRCQVGRARSVPTSVGRGPDSRAPVKNRRVAARSRFPQTRTSMTWPNWSIARYRYTRRPVTLA
jgi:hypothetical protein